MFLPIALSISRTASPYAESRWLELWNFYGLLCEVGLKPEIIALGQPKIANLKKKLSYKNAKYLSSYITMSKMRWLGIDIDFFFYFDVFDKVAIMKSLSCSPDPTAIPKLQILIFHNILRNFIVSDVQSNNNKETNKTFRKFEKIQIYCWIR